MFVLLLDRTSRQEFIKHWTNANSREHNDWFVYFETPPVWLAEISKGKVIRSEKENKFSAGAVEWEGNFRYY